MKRHAYLVLAHDNQFQLEQLLSLLEDDRNDIYLQADAKGSLQLDPLAARHPRLVILPPMRICWAAFSMIRAELALLRRAVDGHYHYYHLLTGSDLPLVSQDVIHAHLEHSDEEYINFAPEYKDFAHFKAAYYHLLLETANYKKIRLLHAIRHGLVRLQMLVGMDRSRKSKESFYHGSTYFSITHPFARYVLAQEPWIARTFHHGLSCDEVFMQTLVMKSPFRDHLHDPRQGMTGNLRYINWRRREGNSPYTFRMADWEELMQAGSKAFFARKFNRAVDSGIVDALVARLSTRVPDAT